jgi:hypothetical protein
MYKVISCTTHYNSKDGNPRYRLSLQHEDTKDIVLACTLLNAMWVYSITWDTMVGKRVQPVLSEDGRTMWKRLEQIIVLD